MRSMKHRTGNLLGRLLCAVLLCCGLMAGSALADSLTFNNIYATVNVPSTYVVLTKNNLSQHPEAMERLATTVEMTEDDWAARGVMAQAWTENYDVCIEFTAVQDEQALQYFNIATQSSEVRKAYRTAHKDGTLYGAAGYTYEDSAWKKGKAYGTMLYLTYRYAADGETWSGYQYRTIRNGYTITVDYKVLDRERKKADATAL